MTRRRGQLVLLAAAVVVTALVPMLLAYAQVGASDAVVDPTADERAALEDTRRTLERSVSETTLALANRSGPDAHGTVATRAGTRFEQTAATLRESGTERGVAVSVERNATAAREWASDACPRGPARTFGTCVATDGVVTQTRANTTAFVAVAVDVSIRGPDATASATFVVRGVRGTVADPNSP
ncbi:hypothetical protein SAMN04488065_1240 [Haloplanus vescus]|uniref:Uncharacterized protein n=1 Tax=Haloplanus vescus TaxID=555874 RepID=A0A1H3WYL4_9EURY|nr:hypothetical protein [Haloplanus vescus]SDZ92287.1 hypothetical protein SAMN04488065_1240 [Haloplanus vescus]